MSSAHDGTSDFDPGSVATLRDLGMLTLETGDLDRAQKTFRALLLQKLEAVKDVHTVATASGHQEYLA